jgi:hypothetical protein
MRSSFSVSNAQYVPGAQYKLESMGTSRNFFGCQYIAAACSAERADGHDEGFEQDCHWNNEGSHGDDESSSDEDSDSSGEDDKGDGDESETKEADSNPAVDRK